MAHPTETINILFPSVGRRVELLRAFRRAYQELGLSGRIVVTDVDPLAPALQEADCVYVTPRYTHADYVPTLIEICRREAIDLIFPLIDPDIPILAQQREALAATGARPAVVTPAAAAIAGDKWLTAAFFRDLGIPTPRSWLPQQLDPESCAYPLFIKPRRGSAAEHTFKVRNARELAFFGDYVPEPIIQEYVPGPEITNDIVCDLDGNVLSVVSRQRIAVRSGEVVKGVTIYDPEITAICIRIAEKLPAIGPITVQCMMKGDVATFIEINARMGGGLPLGLAAGVEAPRWLLARAAGIDCQVPAVGTYQTGLYLTRFDDSFFLTETTCERLAQQL